jgi:FtsZ-interacting cell division protein ZipA
MKHFNSKHFIGVIIMVLLLVALWPNKKNRLEHIEDRIQEVQEKRKVLTEKEKQLEKLANEKDWEEVDKETDK